MVLAVCELPVGGSRYKVKEGDGGKQGVESRRHAQEEGSSTTTTRSVAGQDKSV